MKTLLTSIALLITTVPAFAIEPVRGSITPENRAMVSKAPVGSVVFNQVWIDGDNYHETYVVEPDHSLKLVARQEYQNH